jgi:penicillin-binding protein-related factor A (putative recombinase)
MARNEFEREVGDLLRMHFPFVHRIADAAFNRNLGRQVSKKPFDYFGINADGRAMATEVKRVKVNRFAFQDLKEHQFDALDAVWATGGNAILFLNFRVKAPGARCGRAFWIPFEEFKIIKGMAATAGRKSMRPSDIPACRELARIKGGWRIQDGVSPDVLV